MNQAKINYWIDIGIGLSFLVSFVAGIIKWPGLMAKLGVRYASLPLRTLTFLHDWGGLLLGLFALLHIIFHWRWICSMTKSFFKKKKTRIELEQ
jgi:hypothetical protein